MRILAVRHGPDVGPELLGDVARDEGHELVEWDIASGARPPEELDAVIVLGGAQNVGEESTYPWLNDEYEAIRGWLASGTPLLGVCLGCQTLARAAGGVVAPVERRFMGFYPAELTDEGRADPLLGALPARFDALNANGYACSVPPPGAVTLATTGSLLQAFRAGERAWGVQFHPEARRDQVLRWCSDDRELPKPVADVTAELDAGIARWHELGRALGRAFLRVAAG